MNVMRRRVLQLAGIAAITIAIPLSAWAIDYGTIGAVKLAMGPTSAAQKPGGPVASTNNPASLCSPFERPCSMPHSRSRHRHARFSR